MKYLTIAKNTSLALFGLLSFVMCYNTGEFKHIISFLIAASINFALTKREQIA